MAAINPIDTMSFTFYGPVNYNLFSWGPILAELTSGRAQVG
jgi:hypothetical protein